MNTHAYNLRSRINSPATLRTPTSNTLTTPTSRTALRSPLKQPPAPSAIHLDHVIGTTTTNASGLTSCPATNSFAYCAGSTAVLATIQNPEDEKHKVSYRYYKARPTVVAVNLATPCYDTPTTTPTRKRASFLTPRRESERRTPTRTYSEEESTKTWTARERIKSVTCVSLNNNGTLFAVGEAGYNPRVLLFSTAPDAPTDIPLSIITEHAWGVRSIAFSPDSKYLATLGDANDGFLFIWKVAPKTGALRLHATNKCTTNICHMAWCGQRLITVGTRHIKIWNVFDEDNPSPTRRTKVRDINDSTPSFGPVLLHGRNCLLGDFVDTTFTCVVAVNEQHVLVCADSGQLCTVDVSKAPTELALIDNTRSYAGAVALRDAPQRLVWAGGGNKLQETLLHGLMARNVTESPSTDDESKPRLIPPANTGRSVVRQSLGLGQQPLRETLAISCLNEHTISIAADSSLALSPHGVDDTMTGLNELSSHHEPVQGVQILQQPDELGRFFTWSKTGEIRFWSVTNQILRIEKVDLEEQSDLDDTCSNELRVVRHVKPSMFISGDRFGVLQLHKAASWKSIQTTRAHSAEVNDICLDASNSILASCGRDRMVQVFKLQDEAIQLIQTLDEHIAAVTQLLFSHDGETLLSCSSDRTIVIREKARKTSDGQDLVAFLQSRVITIKASPVSMCLLPDSANILYVSTLDKFVTKVDFSTGSALESFKTSDPETDESAVIAGIRTSVPQDSPLHRPILIGYCSSDKSVRAYDLEKHTLLGKESAHTEGISDIAVFEDQTGDGFSLKRHIISTGHDSTIMLWSIGAIVQLLPTPAAEVSEEQLGLKDGSDSTPAKPSLASLPPLRKILTKVDIAEFAKTSPRSLSREPSPSRLRRKTSRLAMTSTAITETNENRSPISQLQGVSERAGKSTNKRSPSPQSRASTMKLKKQRSRPQIGKDLFTKQSEWLRRSPSPPPTDASSASRQEQKANKARLRRPPSVPTDLRAHAQAQTRRASMVVTSSDAASISMANSQTIQILKQYRKKLEGAKGDTELTDLEAELEAVLKVVKDKRSSSRNTVQRRASTRELVRKNSAVSTGSLSETGSGSASGGSLGRAKGKALDMSGLSVLLEKASLT